MYKPHLLICVFALFCGLEAASLPDFDNLNNTENVTFLLTTPKSGSNLIAGCLSAITRKPISWLNWGKKGYVPTSNRKTNISYNRLNLPLVSDIPLLYRSHYDYAKLKAVPAIKNRLIFVTRNPKELLYRKWFLENPNIENPDGKYIKVFMNRYLESFNLFNVWEPSNRMIVFYEDFILEGDAILIKILQFMNEEPHFLEDYLENKEKYQSELLLSYAQQHLHNSGGASAREGPKSIYYTRNASRITLKSIDQYLKESAPTIWETYLKRYETDEIH